MYEKLVSYFKVGHPRSLKAKKNIAASLIFRLSDTGLGLLLVPIVLNYLDQTNYGIWLTMLSIVNWFGFLNIGLGQGLRNKFAESKAHSKHIEVKHYVSTTYAIIIFISAIFLFIFLIANNYIPWTNWLNIDTLTNSELSTLAIIVFGSFSIRLVLQLILIIAMADQLPAVQHGVNLINKILVFIIIVILTKMVPSSIIDVSLVYALIPLFVLLLISIYFFSTKYKLYKPSIKFIDLKYANDLLSIGWKFLVIQISGLVLVATDNFIISNIFNPDLVVPYQISYKYFSSLTVVYFTIIQPLWSATTDAKSKKEFNWINNAIKKYTILLLLFGVILLIILFLSPFIYKIWIGDRVIIPQYLNILWASIVFIQMVNAIPASYLNGMGFTYVSVLTSFIVLLINIPLSYMLSYMSGNTSGVLLATFICLLLLGVIRIIQYIQVLKGKTGIWVK